MSNWNLFGISGTGDVEQVNYRVNGLSSTQQQISKAHAQTAKKVQQLSKADEKIVEKVQQLSEAQKQAAENVQQLSEADEKIVEKVQQLSEVDEKIVEKVQQLSEIHEQAAEHIQQNAENLQQILDVQAQLNTALIVAALTAVVCVSAILIYQHIKEKSYDRNNQNDYPNKGEPHDQIEFYSHDQSDTPSSRVSETDSIISIVPIQTEPEISPV